MRSRMKPYLICLLIFAPGSFPAMGQGTKVDGEVTYVSGTAYYTNLGTDAGFEKGDSLFTQVSDMLLVVLRIESITRKSSVCKKIDPHTMLKAGTAVFGFGRAGPADAKPDSSYIGAATEKHKTPVDWSEVSKELKEKNGAVQKKLPSAASRPSHEPNQLTGRISAVYYGSRDRNNSEYTYHQPGGVLNLGLHRISGSFFTINTYVRFRRTISDRETRSANYPARVHEFELSYEKPGNALHYSVGRVSSSIVNGIGYFDGGILGYHLTPDLEIGTFGGTQPDYRKSSPDFETSKFGIYMHHKKLFGDGIKSQSTVAFSGQYFKGKIDREFFYLQNSASFGRDLYLYQSAELGINRSSESRRDTDIELSNIYLMARYRPVKSLSFTGSYDARKNVFLVQTFRSIPDSLFDDALRQGLKGGVRWKATNRLTLSINSSVRTKKGDDQNTFLNSGGVYYANVLESRINLSARVFATNTPYTDATSVSFGVSRQIRNLYLTGTFRTYHYDLSGRNVSFDRQSYGIGGNYRMNKKIYSSFDYEFSTGDDVKSDRLYLELGYRF